MHISDEINTRTPKVSYPIRIRSYLLVICYLISDLVFLLFPIRISIHKITNPNSCHNDCLFFRGSDG